MSAALGNVHPALRRCWPAVTVSADVGPSPLAVRLLGDDLVVARLGAAP